MLGARAGPPPHLCLRCRGLEEGKGGGREPSKGQRQRPRVGRGPRPEQLLSLLHVTCTLRAVRRLLLLLLLLRRLHLRRVLLLILLLRRRRRRLRCLLLLMLMQRRGRLWPLQPGRRAGAQARPGGGPRLHLIRVPQRPPPRARLLRGGGGTSKTASQPSPLTAALGPSRPQDHGNLIMGWIAPCTLRLQPPSRPLPPSLPPLPPALPPSLSRSLPSSHPPAPRPRALACWFRGCAADASAIGYVKLMRAPPPRIAAAAAS